MNLMEGWFPRISEFTYERVYVTAVTALWLEKN